MTGRPGEPQALPTARAAAHPAVRPPSAAPDELDPHSTARAAEVAPRTAPSGSATEQSREPLMTLAVERVALPVGRSQLRLELPASRFVSVGVVGPQDALLSFELRTPPELGDLPAHRSLQADGRLPSFVSFQTGAAPTSAVALVEVSAPAMLWRWSADPTAVAAPSKRELSSGRATPRPLIGLPAPVDERDGYVLETPERYLFLRVDIAVALRAAFRQTAIRYRRNPIGVGHASQWDGSAPGNDLAQSLHIGHRGGTELDLGLPSSDDSPSTITRRCEGVRVEKEVLRCAPGSVRDVDAVRLAYFLGLLLDGPTPNGAHQPRGRVGPTAVLDSILTDEAYIEEIRRAAGELRRRHWIHDEGYAALMEDGLLRPSPWHTDHVHLRFVGEPAAPPGWTPASPP